MKTVHIILVRHCETEENVKAQHLNETLKQLRRWRLPTLEQLSNSVKLVALDINSKVTDLGKRQVRDMSMTLQDVDFWGNFQFDICAYSPLDRTRDTCLGIIPSDLHQKCIPLELLREIEIYEHAMPSILKARILKLEHWIMDQNKESIVLVGHSRYFHKLLASSTYMWNCDVWQTAFVFDPVKRTGKWNTATLLFRSPLAQANPIEGIFASLRNGSERDIADTSREARRKEKEAQRQELLRKRTEEATANGDVTYEEPICRICQAKQSEMPDAKMIRPCKCTGSVEFVHLDCLNQWRATSPSAYAKCSVCQYSYRIRKSRYAEWLLNSTVLISLSVGIVVSLATIIGLVAMGVLDNFFPAYNSQVISEYLGLYITLSPRQCKNPKQLMKLIQESLTPMNTAEVWGVRIWISLACSTWISVTMRSLVLGVLVLSLAVHLYQIYAFAFRRDANGFVDQHQFPGFLGVSTVWICNDMKYSVRLFAVFGFVLSCNRVYTELSTQSRKYAHEYLGSVVLDMEDEE